MTRRPIRLMLVLVTLIAAGAACYEVVRLQVSATGARAAERAFSTTAAALATRVADLRAAQQAYVAAGQGDEFWGSKVTEALTAAKQELEQLKQSALAAPARKSLDGASSQIESFERMDARARENTTSGQQLMASDLIFTDGLEITRAIASEVDAARVHEQQASDAALEATTRRQAAVLGGAALLTLIVLLLLAVTGRRDRAAAAREAFADESNASARADDVPDIPSMPAAEIGRTAEVPGPAMVTASADGANAQTLRAAAELCTDLGRVASASELPGLLDRAARLLDATGLILWMADAPGSRLRPVLTHGYGANALSRIKPIEPEADNATAAAYRQARIETVRTNGTNNGAIVAPIISPMGCVGVMAAEVRNGAECKTSLQAMASILAAQLSALVTATPQIPEEGAPQELSSTALSS